jgi:3-deoxy-D-manno-octulosonic-acid transferase
MLRLLYSLLIYVAAAIALLVTAWRGIRNPLYRDRIPERLGYSRLQISQPVIWVHAVSVGEVQAAAPLIRALQRRYPDRSLLVTTATPTGAQRVKALFTDGVTHAYLPYDLPGAVRRFLDRMRPQIAIVMETEVWPNLYRECARRGVPIVLASARLSEKSVRRFRRIGSLFAEALSRDIAIGAQTQADADRFVSVGADPATTRVTGNIKFDLQIADDVRMNGHALREQQFAARFVWVAGSTHEGEEEILLQAHRRVLQSQRTALLILVPRHPNRFERVRQWLIGHGIPYVSRSSGQPIAPDKQVLLVDTLGELLMFYAAADVAFVGGSLVPIGGHNLLEPAALARPVLTGPHNFNAPDIAQLLLENHAAEEVRSAPALTERLLDLGSHPDKRIRMGRAALDILDANRGALARVMALIEAQLR